MDQAFLRHSLDDLATLLQVSREIGPAVDLDTLLRRIEEATLAVIGCERVTVFVLDQERRELRSRLATGGQEIRVPLDRGIAAEAFQARQVVNCADVTLDQRFNAAVDEATGFRTRSLLAVPLIGYEKRAVGVIEFLNKIGGGFTDADEEMAATLASLTAIALQRQMLLEEHSEKQRVDRDLELARKIQRSLLPEHDPRIDGFDIAGWSKAAHAVGGDFYDYLGLETGRLGIVLGDVVGHGLGSSLLACECRALIRAVASMTTDLATIITRANAILHADLKSERFVTLFLGDLDIAAARITYVSAGHAPLFYCPRRGGTCSRMDATTVPLGIQASVDGSPAGPLDMKEGDILTLVTDGFDEWANADDEQFGTERIFEVIRAHRSEPAVDLIKRLHDAVLAFSGGTRQEDDLTALVVKKL